MTPLANLEQVFQRLNRLHHLQSICGWDEAVNMPAGGGEKRGQALAELAAVTTEMLQDPNLASLFHACSQQPNLSPWQQASIEQMRKVWRQANVLPVELVKAKSIATSKCEQAWRGMRNDNDWLAFKPYLSEVVALVRQEAHIRAEANGMSRYDALLDLYEPGACSDDIDLIFAQVKSFLPDLTHQILDKQKGEAYIQPRGPFPIESQKALGICLMTALGFNFQHGRLDVSHHPFCGGVPTDVRITTRYNEEDFTESLMGVLHETGHACYEQGLPKEWSDWPVGRALSMGMHESQSLLFEMQISRGLPFIRYMAPLIERNLGAASNGPEVWRADNIHKLYTRVKPGYIRVHADEVTYPAHVILRYEIEKLLIAEKIEVDDIPDIWDSKMREYLGLSTGSDYRDGCMQDVHWPSGAIGYFPTYTLGAMIAAQLYQAMSSQVRGLEQDIEKGEFANVRAWLLANIWSQGRRYSVDELLIKATGEKLNPSCFERHLRSRYLT